MELLILPLAAGAVLGADAAVGAPPTPGGCLPGREARLAPARLWSTPGIPFQERLGRTLLQQSDWANGALYGLGALAVELGADPPGDPRWTASAGFEDDARSALAAGSRSAREDADLASDVLRLGGALAPLWLDAGLRSWLLQGDCALALELAGEAAEALALTLLLTEGTKVIAGRERPFQRECAADPRRDDDCFRSTSRESFFSGHSSLAAAGAGLLCRNTYLREEPLWGRLGSFRNPLPCALSVGGAVATGLLRVRADQHWLGDVLMGWGIGFAVGMIDLPGPFDALRFRYRTPLGPVEGAVAPHATPGSAGLRLAGRF